MFYGLRELKNKSDRDGSDTASSELDLFDFSDNYEPGFESSDSDCLSSPNVQSASEGKMGFDDRPPAAVNDSWGPCTFQISKFGFSGYSNSKINIPGSTSYEIYRHFLTDEIFQLIVDKTNLFTQQFISSRRLCRRSSVLKQKDTNKEIKKL